MTLEANFSRSRSPFPLGSQHGVVSRGLSVDDASSLVLVIQYMVECKRTVSCIRAGLLVERDNRPDAPRSTPAKYVEERNGYQYSH